MGDLVNINYSLAGSISILGYLVVFLGLFLLMIVILLLGRIMMRRTQQLKQISPAIAENNPQVQQRLYAEGEIELYGVNHRDAAIVLAIVADRSGIPLDRLRVKSIKEVLKQ